jgi:hypothetical protein
MNVSFVFNNFTNTRGASELELQNDQRFSFACSLQQIVRQKGCLRWMALGYFVFGRKIVENLKCGRTTNIFLFFGWEVFHHVLILKAS